MDLNVKKETIPPCDYYCDTQYLLPYSTFVSLPSGFILSIYIFNPSNFFNDISLLI